MKMHTKYEHCTFKDQKLQARLRFADRCTDSANDLKQYALDHSILGGRGDHEIKKDTQTPTLTLHKTVHPRVHTWADLLLDNY